MTAWSSVAVTGAGKPPRTADQPVGAAFPPMLALPGKPVVTFQPPILPPMNPQSPTAVCACSVAPLKTTSAAASAIKLCANFFMIVLLQTETLSEKNYFIRTSFLEIETSPDCRR